MRTTAFSAGAVRSASALLGCRNVSAAAPCGPWLPLVPTLQSAASHAHDDVVSRVELVRDSLASLEARLGLPYGSDSSTAG